MPPVVVGPRCNRRVTCDASPSNDRSESAIAVNPLDAYNIVGSSKKFTDPHTYAFSLAAYYTFDGGQSWNESPPLALLPGWAGTSDPAVAWDDFGDAYLVALPFGPLPSMTLIGIAVYKSTDGGRTWSAPILIHSSNGDDKQWAAGDVNPASPYHGNVYAAWDDGPGVGGSKLAFARTTDHGATWKGIGNQAAGTALPGINDSGAPELSVAADGTVYIVWVTGGGQIKFVKSVDGGNSFSAAAVVANITPIPFQLPGGKFRTLSLPTGCTGAGNNVVCAWADNREGVSRVYYRRSVDGGNTWEGPATGQPLLIGAASSPAGRHDFHPQLISTPTGEIGCTFYEFWTGAGGAPAQLIDVILAVSTDNGMTFPNRVTVTDHPWDPTVDEVWAHGDPNVTFIGDYFGFDASRLGFFPFWTDTRTGIQEIFTSRVSVNPADVYIRESSSDIGDVPSPGNHWEYVDLIVRRQPDGNVNFINEDLLRDGITDHYVYGRVTNRGPSDGRNLRLAVTVGNYPSLLGLPNAEFRYPQDWYPGDWDSAASQNNHLYLGESAPISLPNGATQIIGPVVWPAAQIPDHAQWHPCLLAEARADNNDSAGGPNGGPLPAEGDVNSCNFGSFFWGSNNVCQRNLSYANVVAGAAALIEFPFLLGSAWSKARFVDIIVEKGRELADTPMRLRVQPIKQTAELPTPPRHRGELVFPEGSRVVVRVEDSDIGEIVAAPGSIWRGASAAAEPVSADAVVEAESVYGAERDGDEWTLNTPRASLGFPVRRGEMRRAILSFRTPNTLKPGTRTLLRIFQRNDRRVITGSVILQVQVHKPGAMEEEAHAASLEGLAAQSRFIFVGTVKQVHAATFSAVPASERTAIVTVDEVAHAPQTLGDYLGQEITVQLGAGQTVPSGAQRIFFTNGWLYGEGLAVQSVGTLPVEGDIPTLKRRIAQVVQTVADRELEGRIAEATLVVEGEVTSVVPATGFDDRPVTFHDPDWHDAIIRVADVAKGARPQKELIVRFANSRDVMWKDSPKFHVGQEGIWILGASQAHDAIATTPAEPGAVVFAALHPLDFHPDDQLARVKSLIDGTH